MGAEASVLSRAPNSLGLVGYWSLNDGAGVTATDFSGQKNSGTLTNMDPSTDWVNGRHGKALDFDGSNDYVDLGTRLDQNGAVTISVWIKTNTVATGIREIVANCNSAGNACDYAFEINRTAGRISLLRSAAAVTVTGNTSLSAGVWYHVVGVLSGSAGSWTGTIYVNGVKDNSGSDVNNPSGNNETTTIGRAGAGSLYFFNGLLDDVRIYNRALSAGEVKALYQAGQVSQRNPNNSGLVGYWSMNDGATATTTDSSGLGNHGTLINMDPSTDWVNGRHGKALDFDGSNDYVSVASSTAFNLTSTLSYSVWFRFTTTWTTASADQGLISHREGSGLLTGWEVGFDAPTGLRVLCTDSGPSNSCANMTAPTTFDGGRWYHLVTSWNGSVIKTYLNGALVVNASYIQNSAATGVDLRIGRGGAISGNFGGTIDEPRLYNRALTDAEMLALYRGGAVKHANPNNLGLVGYWSMNDGATATTTDSSGLGNHGGLINMDPSTDWVNGRHGKALDFDGSNDYVDAGSAASITDLPAITVSAWIFPKTAGENNRGRIICKATDCTSVLNNGWFFGITDANLGLTFMVDMAPDLQWPTVNNVISLNKWQHVAVTWNGSTGVGNVQIYVNGVAVSRSGGNGGGGTRTSDSGKSLIVGECASASCAFNGLIDDVRVYNRALSAAEVRALYESR